MKATEQTVDWLSRYYDALDGLRFDEVEPFLAEGIVSHYPTGATVAGREALMTRSQANLARLERIRHAIRNVWEEDDDTLVFELDVTYWCKDGSVHERGGVGIFTVRDSQIHEQRLYVDASEVWSRA